MTRFVVSEPGIGKLLLLDGVAADLARRAGRVAVAAGPGHEVQMWKGRSRHRATVRTATRKASRQEAQTHGLIGALDAARGDG